MVDAYNFHLTGINDTVNPAVNPEIDYWAKWRETCESKSNVEKITLPPENDSFQLDFVKERLSKTTLSELSADYRLLSYICNIYSRNIKVY